jgi:DNA-3-methyladenine glycosylase II
MSKVVFIEKLSIFPLPPFNFELSAAIFADGDKQIRRYENGRFWQTLRIDNKLILATVASRGTVNEPRLSVELKSNRNLTEADKQKAKKSINVLFNLDFDLDPFYEETKKDPIMARITQRLHGLKNPTTQFAIEALTDSIVEQQISLKVANVLERKLTKNFGDTLSLEGDVYYAYPTPERLASATTQELRTIGLSQRKAEYIKAVSALAAEEKLDFEALKKRENVDEIIRELDKIRGVGVWTAEFTLIRGMQRLEALPADDLGLRRTISRYYCLGRSITSLEARKIAKRWGRWKGLSAYYLIVAEMLGIES